MLNEENKTAIDCCILSKCGDCPLRFTQDCIGELSDASISFIDGMEYEIERLKSKITQAKIEVLEQVKQLICDNTYPAFDMAGKPVNIWNPLNGFDAIDKLIAKLKGE